MIGPAELSAGITSLRFAFDIARGLKDIADATERNGKIMELQGAIMDAQAGAIEAQQAHAMDVKRIADLEAEIAGMKCWEAEKVRYELKAIGSGAFAYMLKPEARGTEPPHWLCQNCYENGKKRILQPQGHSPVGRGILFRCLECSGELRISEAAPKWVA